MAQYDNSYNMKVTPNKPTLRGIDTNYDSSGQVNQGGIGLGDLYQLDYDRNKIEQIFNQGTDAQYALIQKENQIAQNQYANNQFANQQSALETLRQQRNNQIASGMARGLNAAQEQGTVLGLQQEAASGALELANQQQLEADKIAAEYANNVSKALQEANSVKQAMAQVAAQMYEADMLGYTGELNYAGQMDANAVNKYGYDLGLEGTKYTADKNYEAAEYTANKNYEGTEYAANKNYDASEYTANKNYEGTKYNADQNRAAQEYAALKNYEGTKYAADQNRAAQENAARISAAATKAISSGSGKTEEETKSLLDKAIADGISRGLTGNDLVNYTRDYLVAQDDGYNTRNKEGALWDQIDSYIVANHSQYKNQTKADWDKLQKEQQQQQTVNYPTTQAFTPAPNNMPLIPALKLRYNW